MNKPITLVREDFAKSLLELINNTPLPAFVKVDVLSGFTRTLEQVAMEEYQREKQEWEKQNKEEEANE